MEYPEGLAYTKEHEWVAVDGTHARVGITDYAQDALGDIVFVSLPSVGTAVTASRPCAEVESTKSVSDIYAPVSGTIVEINTALANTPEKVNQDPYGDGWLFTIDVGAGGEVSGLLDVAAYRALVEAG
jgi:glycine cleavage system H protein